MTGWSRNGGMNGKAMQILDCPLHRPLDEFVARQKLSGKEFEELEGWFYNYVQVFDKVNVKASIELAIAVKAKRNQCYHNCWMADVAGKYLYYEGYMSSDFGLMAFDHSWLVDRQTHEVIDPTLGVSDNLSEPHFAKWYCGIEIPRENINKWGFELGKTGDFLYKKWAVYK